ncbi:hypothetical protein NIT7645_01495 [Phaeobacter italicus]|jgi:hypothetical protein|uniref:Uncharacterized protein n=1 Tax=Phaeobacter italicus TaxID=481446 RepID=A0A0H5DKA2_9RHOB|nr:hypothetical protein NIT7321_00176 [Phaeobacter italicus]CRL14465.1 hypothetical protein NIT7645_01495 [Phaeobacter italicus]SFG31098.1 hypothetical protein SAMN04488019_101832 [Phaeobacter italicus]
MNFENVLNWGFLLSYNPFDGATQTKGAQR